MKTIEVAAAIIERDGRILATQRGYGEFKGWWEFPGGKIEAGETPRQAVVREIREELDTSVAVVSPVADVSFDYPDFHLHMRCYRCRLEGGAPILLEHSAARWVDARTIDELRWLPADIQVVAAIKEQGIVV